jgi:hypothetical protein
MFDVEKSIAQARGKFNRLAEFVRTEAQSKDAYAVERHLFDEGLQMLLDLLAAYFEAKEGGDVGRAIETESGRQLPRERLKSCRYLSVFGELALRRWYYHEDGAPGVFPLDEDVNLPERMYSYFVQELLGHRVGRMAYDEVLGEMERLFGFRLYKHTVEALAAEAARDVDAYYEAQGTPPPETEAEVLVAAVDGKGVPMVKGEPAERRVRLRKGEKRSRKKEAVVSAVYTIAAQPRTAEAIVREVRDREPPPGRPKPQNKRLRATLKGKTDAFEWVRREIERRDPDRTKHRVCLMDGSRGLWKVALATLRGFTFILDLFHALEYLWKAAYVFHPEGSAQAEAFVRHRLRLLLEGKVGYVIGGLRQMLTKHHGTLRKAQRATLEQVIGYYEANRRWMRYDAYIAAGYPIGSGAVEGACRHLVKERMEGSGMRWSVGGAESVLHLRAVYLNGDWDGFWAFHMRREAAGRFDGGRRAPHSVPEPMRAAG